MAFTAARTRHASLVTCRKLSRSGPGGSFSADAGSSIAVRYETNPRRFSAAVPAARRALYSSRAAPDFSAVWRLWATRKRQSSRHGNRAHRQRLEFDQRGTAFSGGERGGMIHTAAARPHELLAFRQDLHQFLKARLAPVGLEQTEGERHNQRRRRCQSRRRRKVRHHGGVHSGAGAPFAAHRLGRRPQVVLPIARRRGSEARRPLELPETILCCADGADAADRFAPGTPRECACEWRSAARGGRDSRCARRSG